MKILKKEEQHKSDGTYLQGGIIIEYQKIVEILGESIGESEDHKAAAQWIIEFEDGIIATIYNWKNSKNYIGEKSTDTKDITHWNIGGNTQDVVGMVKELFR